MFTRYGIEFKRVYYVYHEVYTCFRNMVVTGQGAYRQKEENIVNLTRIKMIRFQKSLIFFVSRFQSI